MAALRSLAAGFTIVLATGLYACHDNGPARRDTVPAALDVVAGDAQSGTVGLELAQPLIARVLNSAGEPLAGQIVNFRVLKGDGSVFAGAALTNADGLAQERWTLGKSVADSQVVEARAVDASSGAPLVFARFVATAVADAPVTIEKSSGDFQGAVAGQALPESVRVRLKDVYDNPVAGATVSWNVRSGGGTVNPASRPTNATGYASTKWTLGTDIGSQSVEAVAGTTLSASFAATSSTQPTTSVSKSAGDGQVAAPGSTVAIPPSVKVVDSNGAPRAGASITFAVTKGGGSVSGANAITDAQGIATVGSWVLGSQPGQNALSATLAGGGSVTFNATGVQLSPDLSLSVTSPSGGLVGDTVPLRIDVTSRLQVASVHVTLSGRTVALTSAGSGAWTGTISLLGAPRDTMTLVATATDVNGASAQAIAVVTHDRKPRVVVTSPSDNGVANPNVQIDATCDDDDQSGCVLSARLSDGTLLAGPSPSLHASVSLASLAGGIAVIAVTAQDSKDQATSESRAVWVENSAHLVLIGFAEGNLLDVSDSRLLWQSLTRTSVGTRDLNSGVNDTILTVSSNETVATSLLTPTGAAISVTSPFAPYASVYFWRNGALTNTTLNSSSIAGSGAYVIYTAPPIGRGRLTRRDVTSGSDVLIDTAAINTGNSVTDNGDVAYMGSEFNIYRYRAGAITAITSGGGATYPLTDGINIVFRRQAACCSDPVEHEIWLFDGAALSMLAPARAPQEAPYRNSEVTPRDDYMVNGGWTAFTKADGAAIVQVWTRSPAGALRAVSNFSSPSIIRGLGSDGSVIFDNGVDRYLAGPGGGATRISYHQGVVHWQNGRFVVLLGNSAFSVTP